MEFLTEVVLVVFGGTFYYILKQLSNMKDKQGEIDKRLGIEEAKGDARDSDSKDIKQLLRQIASDIIQLKEEQGYWRGRHEEQS